MSIVTIPIKRLLFGHDYWRSHKAINEMEVYCDLLDIVDQRVSGLENPSTDEGVTLINVKAVLCSYPLEIGMKSLWALDNPDGVVKDLKHDILKLYGGLKSDTVESLKQIGLTKDALEEFPKPFESNRYSMEKGSRDIVVYETSFLRDLARLVSAKLEDSKKRWFT